MYNAAGAIARVGIGLVAIPLLIRLIGVEEYGLWILVSAAVGILGLAEAGLSVSTTFFLSRDLAENDAASVSQTLTVSLGAMALLATAAALVLWFGSGLWIGFFPNISESQHVVAVKAFQIGGLVIWARLLQQILVSVEQAFQRYGIINTVNTVQSFLSQLGLVAVAWLGGRTLAMMQWQAVTTIGILVAHAGVAWLLLRHLKPYPAWNAKKSLAVMRYSLLTWLGTLGGVLFNQGDRLVVGALLGTGALGVYGAITNVTVQINGLSALIVQPLLPLVGKLTARRDHDQALLREHVKRAFRLNAFAALGMGGALITLAPLVMGLLIPGEVPAEYVLAFRAATIIYALYSMNAIGYYLLFAVNKVSANTLIALASGSVSLCLIAIGGRAFGLMGAVIGNAGFLFTWLMIWMGMDYVRIGASAWLRWAGFPLFWFFATVLSGFILPYRSLLLVLVLVLQLAILLGWFLTTQEMIMLGLKERIARLRSSLLLPRSM